MYNFGIPSQLKAYFDHVARAGVTFSTRRRAAVGLLTWQEGVPRDRAAASLRRCPCAYDLRARFLAFLGITDVETVYAEGLAISPASKDAASPTREPASRR
jgi:FMN-dependent NADH-azoreductase